jgi:hypothetical protein
VGASDSCGHRAATEPRSGAKLLLDIESVGPVEPFTLRIQFGFGECKVVDIYAMRGTNPMFAPLWNWEEFKKVRFTPDVVEWFRGLKALETEGQDLGGGRHL